MQKTVAPANNKFIFLIIALAIAVLLYYLAPILMPFLAGALLAYLCNPLVIKLMRYHVPRLLAVIIVFSVLIFGLVLLIVLLVPLIQNQLAMFIEQLPRIIDWVQAKTILSLDYFDIKVDGDNTSIKGMVAENLGKAGGALSWVVQTTVHSGKALFEGLLIIVLIPVVTFYLLRDWDLVLNTIKQMIPGRMRGSVIKFAKESDQVLSAFIRGQLLVMAALSVIYAIGLTLVGLPTGIIIGVIVGIVSIVPYLGLIVGIVIASIAALVRFGTFNAVLWVWLVFAVGHIIENFFLTPTLIGDRLGLHPVVVIFAILAGGTLFGFFGILLALPVAAVIMVLIRNIRAHYHLTHQKIGD